MGSSRVDGSGSEDDDGHRAMVDDRGDGGRLTKTDNDGRRPTTMTQQDSPRWHKANGNRGSPMLTTIVAASVSLGVEVLKKKPAYRGKVLVAALRAMQSNMQTDQGLCIPTGELPQVAWFNV